jgi:hypothetical protein
MALVQELKREMRHPHMLKSLAWGLLNQEFIQALSCISAPRGRREAGHPHSLAWKALRFMAIRTP